MSRSNKQVILDFVEVILNQKHIERIDEYFDPETIFHTGPYVGIGYSREDTAEEKMVVTGVAPGGPSDGKLQIGDELVLVKDGQNTWETHQQLRAGLWGLGVVGTALMVRIRRDDQFVDVALTRGYIQGWDRKMKDLEELKTLFRQFFLDWPDLKVKVECIIEEGDMVSQFSTNFGTNSQYHRQAVWTCFDLQRVRDGKIVEVWSVDDYFSQIKQLGYQITMPAG